ncbi:DUF3047 domain-containing protein [Enterovibrio baiacu]|uniref:DUF3047 domain-containing protein n=1 Tax=Enterovibrio baiacu TaxID=2491023 RepID=UPI003D132B06
MAKPGFQHRIQLGRLTRWPRVGLVFAFMLVSPTLFAAQSFSIDYSTFSDWERKSFKGQTLYALFQQEPDSGAPYYLLNAKSEKSASAVMMEKDIDIGVMPWMSWRWKVAQFPQVDNEKSKQGDDFAIRISVVVQPGFTVMSSQTIVYVWSQQSPEGTSWPNPYSPDHFMMLAASSGTVRDTWHFAQRNVQEDFARIYGETYNTVNAVAIMSDSDNSLSQTRATLSPIVFSAERQEEPE